MSREENNDTVVAFYNQVLNAKTLESTLDDLCRALCEARQAQ